MGNDDNLTFDAVAHLKIIDVSCPQQMLALMKWVMAGNRGLLYVRVMRTPSAVLYDADYQFEFGKGAFVHGSRADAAFIVSSGRGVHEALAAARECAASGVQVAVIDMPSIDEELLLEIVRLRQAGLHCRAEQRLYSAESAEGSVSPRPRSGTGVACPGHQHARPGRAAAIHSFRNLRRADRGVRPHAVAYRDGCDARDGTARLVMTVPPFTKTTPTSSGCQAGGCAGSSRTTLQGEQLLGVRDSRRAGRKSHAGAFAPERRGSDLHHEGLGPRARGRRGPERRPRGPPCCFPRAPFTCSTTPVAKR